MRPYYWIILAIVAANAIGAIVKSLSKNKQQGRLEELAAQRRRAAMQQQPQQPASRPAPATGPGADVGVKGQAGGHYPTGRPLDKLAERRREQLEQLRQRRQQRGAASKPQVRVGKTATPQPTRPATPPGMKPESLAAKMEQSRLAEQRAQRKRQLQQKTAAQQRQTQPSPQRGRRPTTAVRPVIQPAKEVELEAHQLTEKHLRGLQGYVAAGAATTARSDALARSSDLARSVRHRMGSTAALRELFVVKELLDPPISMRTDRF